MEPMLLHYLLPQRYSEGYGRQQRAELLDTVYPCRHHLINNMLRDKSLLSFPPNLDDRMSHLPFLNPSQAEE